MIGSRTIPLVLILYVLLVMAPLCHAVEVGEPIPEFLLETFDGKDVSRSALAGSPVLLVFWNTWCDECKRDLPRINRMFKEYGPKGLVVLAINTGLNDSEKKARVYWKHYGYGFPTGYDSSFEIRKAFRVPGVPAVYLIDATGVVRYRGALPPTDLEMRIMKLRD